MIKLILILTLATFGFAEEALHAETANIQGRKVLDLVFLGAKVVGAIAIILGIIELLVEKDQGGQQGKKITGSMKLLGGALLVLAASVIGWMIGSSGTTTHSIMTADGKSEVEFKKGI